jgi:multimeric flavodoxin WrbA
MDITIAAVYGSPRRRGNTAGLLARAVAGARAAGVQVEEVVLRDLRLSPCLEIYGCRQAGECAIRDDFQPVVARLQSVDGLMLATPIFFYTVSAHMKILMDRCQSLWVRRHRVASQHPPTGPRRPSLFIAAGATRGPRLFAGTLLSMRYFLDVLDAEIWRALLYRGLDREDDVQRHPAYLEEAFDAGGALAELLRTRRAPPERI